MTLDGGPQASPEGAAIARLVRCLQAHIHLADGALEVRRAGAQAGRSDAAWQQRARGRNRGALLIVALVGPGERTQATRGSRAGDRQRRPPPTRALLARTQDQLATFRDRELGRELGSCSHCGKPVRSQQDFIREYGCVIHVRCHIDQPRAARA